MSMPTNRSRLVRCPPGRARVLVGAALAALVATSASGQIKAELPKGPLTPPWNKGIQPINRDSYYNAIECGKQPGNPVCLFYDTGLCKNEEFALALFTPYRQVAYEVWQAVSRKQPAPTPSYGDAQRTRITLGVTPASASRNPLTVAVIKRGGQVVKPATQSLDGGGGRFIFDFTAFAPTGNITIELAGRAKTVSCLVERAVLATFR